MWMESRGAGGLTAGRMGSGKQAKMPMFYVISRDSGRCDLQVAPRRMESGMEEKRGRQDCGDGCPRPSIGVDGERKDCDFALDDGAGERHSAHRKVGHGGRLKPTGNTNRFLN